MRSTVLPKHGLGVGLVDPGTKKNLMSLWRADLMGRGLLMGPGPPEPMSRRSFSLRARKEHLELFRGFGTAGIEKG